MDSCIIRVVFAVSQYVSCARATGYVGHEHMSQEASAACDICGISAGSVQCPRDCRRNPALQHSVQHSETDQSGTEHRVKATWPRFPAETHRLGSDPTSEGHWRSFHLNATNLAAAHFSAKSHAQTADTRLCMK